MAYNSVGQQYFRTVGIPMVLGRDFTETEAKTDAPVAIVSEGAASRIWPGEAALGKTLQLAADGVPRQAVGVVSNARVGILWRPENAYVYFPIGSKSAYTIVRAPTWSLSVAQLTLQNEGARVHPALKAPVREVEDLLEYAYAPVRFLAATAGLIALLTLVLASFGLYGVLSLSVSRRTTKSESAWRAGRKVAMLCAKCFGPRRVDGYRSGDRAGRRACFCQAAFCRADRY